MVSRSHHDVTSLNPVCEVGEDGGGMSLPVKIVYPQQKKKICPGRDAKTSPPVLSPSSLMFFFTCSFWVSTAAILSSISCRHYGFLRELIKNLFRASTTEQNSLIFYQHCNMSAVFTSVSESTKNMLKQRFSNFFQILEIN